ncbi:MAG: radical SAM protein [archaeon]|jgi:radical SAM superfamily enzyme YgiQ (UPF0313 family)
MKITFIYPPFKHKRFNENVAVVDEEFGLYQPIGLAYAAAIYRNLGAQVDLIDANALKLTKEIVLEKLKTQKPDILSFDLHSAYTFFDNLEWIKYFKDNLGYKVIILVGGFNFNLYPSEVMYHKEIDFGLLGQANTTAKQFMQFFEKKTSPRKIQGLVYRKNGKVIINKQPEMFCNLEELPFPARDLIPMDKYYSFISGRKNFTVMLSQIGCPFRCNFCAIAKVPFKQRSAKSVFEEILECYNKYKVREIDFFDGTFTANKKVVMELCQLIIDSKIDIAWSCRTRIDRVDDELLSIMAKSGCKRIYYGIESSDDKVIINICKDITISGVKVAIDKTRKYKIAPLGFFMIGNPGDTKEGFMKTVELAKSLNLEYAQFSRTIAKPKTEIDTKLQGITKKDYWSDYLLGKVGEERLPNPWCNIPESEVEQLTKKAYLSFYLRPTYVFKRIIGIRSVHELLRYIKAGFKMIFSMFKQEDL